MTPRGVDFLENWIATSISSDAKPDQAKALAARCISDAAALGISREDMEGKWGSVESAIIKAIGNLPAQLGNSRQEARHFV
jgi:hypothetical protein